MEEEKGKLQLVRNITCTVQVTVTNYRPQLLTIKVKQEPVFPGIRRFISWLGSVYECHLLGCEIAASLDHSENVVEVLNANKSLAFPIWV